MAEQTITYRVKTQGTEKASSNFMKLGKTIAGAFGGFALFNELRKAGTAFLDLDKGMRLVNTITKVSGEELKKLTSQVVELSTELGTPTSQMTGAIYQAVSAGVAFENIMKFMATATKGAIAGNANVETSVDALTTIMNSFGFTMNRITEVSDILFKTIELGKTNMNELAGSYALVTPLAAASGVSFKDMSIALGVLTAAGTPTSQAMTQLSAIIVALKKKLGETTFENRSFFEALEEGREEYKKSGKTLTEFLGRKEAELAILGLTGDKANSVTIATKKMETSTGSAAGAFEEMEKSISKNIQNITTLIENKLIVALESVLTNIIAIVNFVEENEGLKLLLKLAAAPLFIGEGSQIDTNEMGDRFEAFQKSQGIIVKKTEEQEVVLKRVFGGLISVGNGYVKIVEKTKETITNTKAIVSEVNKVKAEIKNLNALQDAGNLTLKQYQTNITEITRLENILAGVVEKRFLLSEAFVDSIKARGLEQIEPAGIDREDFVPTEFAKLPATVVVGLKEEMEVIGVDVFAGWNTILSSNMISAWEDIFGEANSLFEKLIKDMAALLISDVFASLLSFLPGGSLLSGFGSILGFGSVASNNAQTIQINIGDLPFAQAVVNANGTIQKQRLIAQ